MIRLTWINLSFLMLAATTHAGQPGPTLLAHWKLAHDAKDSSLNGHDGIAHSVAFRAMPPGRQGTAVVFDGHSSRIEVKTDSGMSLGTGDFTIALWTHTQENLDDDLGDLVTQFDPKKRVGFNLSIRNNTGVTSSQANTRQIQFGIDAGCEPKWTDEGRPGNAALAFAMATHGGNLYAGTASNTRGERGRVYRFAGHEKWVDCGAPDISNTVSAMAVHQGHLYAASSKYRFSGSAMTESDNTNPGGGVFRYEGDSRWSEVGRLPDTEAIGGLVEFRGKLHASSLYKPAGFFRREHDGKWTSLPVPDGKRVESMAVFNGFLWATSYDGGRVYRFDGITWKDFGQLGDNSQTYSFAILRGQLCVGSWPSGKVYRLQAAGWEDLGRLGNELEVMGMLVHNGKLYAGTLPLAHVYRYDGGKTWTRTAQLDSTPDVKYRRAWTMAQYQGRLFCSTLPSGKVHAMDAGPCLTYDHAISPGWHHITAVKQNDLLKLFLDGKQVGESAKFDPAALDLTTREPLLIGAGQGDFFHGSLSDVRFYKQALNPQEISTLARP